MDLSAALRMLVSQHQVTALRVDAGGGLNGALLRAGLADEISIVIAPYLAASAAGGPPQLISGPDNPTALALSLTHTERLRKGIPGCAMPWTARAGP